MQSQNDCSEKLNVTGLTDIKGYALRSVSPASHRYCRASFQSDCRVVLY